jgi:prepilin-type N-terminal cleavage/methylation domain-containing protein
VPSLLAALVLAAVSASGSPLAWAGAAEPAAAAGTGNAGSTGAWLHAVFLILGLFSVLYLGWRLRGLHGRRAENAELDFWSNLLSPLSDKAGSELSRQIERLCDEYHEHPRLGRIRVRREEVLLWLGTIRRCEPERLRLMRRAHRQRSEGGSLGEPTAVHREAAEDAFWYELLVPLLSLSPAEAGAAIRELCGRPHLHPTRGVVSLEPGQLRRRLRWVAQAHWSADLAHVGFARSSADGAAVPPSRATRSSREVTRSESAGFSLPEALVVVAIVALVVGAATLHLKPMEAPVKSAALLVEGLVKQTRAKSMSTTSSYRLRPFTDRTLVVEYASSCSDGAWTLDPRMELDLPRGVTLSDTDWSVCFNSRGTASDNVVLSLEHSDHAAQGLEILMGGAVRWHER